MESWSRSALYEVAQRNREAVGESPGAFFLTLCSVPAPISLPEPKSPSLQRFRFFFTRQVENGIERCWLHFGYFRTAEDARKWRDVLCRVYPAAVIRAVPQGGESQPVPAANNLTDTQVFALLNNGPGAENNASVGATGKSERRRSTLEDTLSELRDSAASDLDLNTDDVSSTGVRHLRVEVQAKPRATVSHLHRHKRK